MSTESVEVEKDGRALKVHTDTPHLVSLGGGRLSTAVTLHPLPEGRTTIGSGPGVDIPVLGSGVESVHCHIDNHAGTVTLVPVAEMTSIDNQRVGSPTRLTQGCMLCVGRSNFLRFNHPAEARLIKNSLPNSRISQLPFGFFPGEEVSVDGKPPAGPRRSWDSWEGLSSASSEEIARYISPKVFPAGSSTVNSPAALVLGPRAGQNKLSLLPLKINGENHSRVDALPQKPVYQNVSPLPNGQFVPRDESPHQISVNRIHSPSPPPMSPGSISSPRNFSTPSPAFDRNPSYLFRRTVVSPNPSNNWGNGLEELSSRISEAEAKRRQVESDRLVEQEAERLERQRLDEILLMCADYEKQAQWERLNKPQQNRIITNGSLPRDKRLPSPNSPHFHQSFTYDSDSTPMSPDSEYKSCSSHEGVEFNNPPPSSPRTRIKTIAGKDPPTPSREHALEVLENRLAILNDYEILGPPPPPRNSSKNVITSQEPSVKLNSSNPTSPSESTKSFSFETQNKLNNNSFGYKPGSIAEANAISKFEFFGFNPRTNEVLNSQNYRNSTESLASNTSKQRDSYQSNTTQTSITRSNTRIETDPFWTSADFMASNFNGDTIKRQDSRNGEYSTEQLMMQLDAIVREGMKTCNDTNDREEMTPSPRSSERDSGIAETAARDSAIENSRDSEIEMRDGEKFIMPLPESHLQMFSTLKMERAKLVAELTSLETKVVDIEQQEEELMRELEIERALVGSELEAQSEKLTGDEQRVASLKERVAECETEMDKCVSQQTERQNQVRRQVEQQQQVLISLEQKLHNCAKDSALRAEILESCKQQQDLLEAERKSFEDLEFSLLEEEAWWLSRREELQREVSEAMTRCAERRERLASLQTQREQAIKHATSTNKLLAQQHAELMDSINKERKRLNQIDAQLQNSTTPKSQSDTEKKQSQDDLERISRVTSGAPMEMSSNSLGRRTIASLQEIERNRHIHLAKQGSLVIEEERKRVSELKRRVQDEARAEWEERRQRENNCHSLNSVGSEESNLTTSDLRTDSAGSEDADKRLGEGVTGSQVESSLGEDTTDQKNEQAKVARDKKKESEHETEKEERQPESRPLSDVSSYSEDLLSVRLRVKNSTSIQRPLTRYLPIKGEALDLRQHIETAGHQVDLCPHVLLDKYSCRGFLHKLTSRFHHWNKRWFVFDRSKRTLTYYMDRSERKPRGGAYFQAIEEVYVDHSNGVKSPNPAVTFVIKSSERTYHLMAPSPEAMRIWVDVVFTGAEGYQEFNLGT